MITLVIIIAIILLYLFFRKKFKSPIDKKPSENIGISQSDYKKKYLTKVESIIDNDLEQVQRNLFNTNDIDDKRFKYIYGPPKIWYESIEKIRHIPRKTYLFGKLTGKFYGSADDLYSDPFEKSDFFKFTIYEAEIVIFENNIFKNEENKIIFNKPITVGESFFPEQTVIRFHTKDFIKEYKAKIHEIQLQNIVFIRHLQQIEDNESFGTIEAELSGYFLDFIEEKYIVEIRHEEKGELLEVIEESIEIPEIEEDIIQFNNSKPKIEKTIPTYIDDSQEYKYVLTENKQFDTRWGKKYVSYEYQKSNEEKYWGPWKFVEDVGINWNEIILSILSVLGSILGLYALLALFIYNWKIGIIISIFIAVIYSLHFISLRLPRLIGGFFRLLGIGIFGLVLFGFFKILTDGFNLKRIKYTTQEQGRTERVETDSLISHIRNWKDYNKKNYIATLSLKKSDLYNAVQYHNNFNPVGENEIAVTRNMYSALSNFDNSKLNLVYNEFNRIKESCKITSRREFAELIVSCIQDIQYVAIMPNSCNPNDYSNKGISDMLMVCECKPNVPFGVQTPIEFLADLKGDCDTRTLLLFTILKNFNYDVAIFNSNEYMHSVLGINLPERLNANYKVIKKGDYYLWETTATGIPIGMLSPENEDTRYWNIYLK